MDRKSKQKHLEYSDFYLREMGLHIESGNPFLAITVDTSPEQDNQHQHWRILGKEFFRAKVAELLLKYHNCDGKKLQQILGNCLSDKKKQNYFDKYVFFTKTSVSKKVNLSFYKHHIVDSFLGFLVEHLTEDELKSYILKNWIPDVWKEKIPENWSGLRILAKTKGITINKFIIKQEAKENQIKYLGQIKQKTGEILVEVFGNSYKYTEKKLIEQGFKKLSHLEKLPH